VFHNATAFLILQDPMWRMMGERQDSSTCRCLHVGIHVHGTYRSFKISQYSHTAIVTHKSGIKTHDVPLHHPMENSHNNKTIEQKFEEGKRNAW